MCIVTFKMNSGWLRGSSSTACLELEPKALDTAAAVGAGEALEELFTQIGAAIYKLDSHSLTKTAELFFGVPY